MSEPRAGERDSRTALLLAIILAGLATIGPFTIDTYMPSFPAIGRAFGATPLQLQQTLSAYLIPFAFMTLFHGTLSDSFGRKPVILIGLGLFAAASVGCALAQSFNQLLVFRALQGMCAGTGMVVGRAMVRDLYQGHHAQRVMSMITMMFGLAPAIAPILGGWLESWFGWRSIFVFLVAFACALLAACWWKLPETLPQGHRHPFRPRPLLANYLKLLRSLRFGLLCSAIAFNFAGFFLYISSAPAVIYNLLGLGEKDFAWLFVPGISGVIIGAFISGRVAQRLSPPRTVAVGYAIMFLAATANVAYCAAFKPGLPWTVLPVMSYTIGMALAMPSLTLLALDLFPHNRGLASSLQGAQHSLFTGLTAGLLSPFVSATALGLAATASVLLACGFACWLAYVRLPAAQVPATLAAS
jgi:DHA1 family bicyclomycin/chloramphenicol resistance-like MFS transporter